MDIIGHKKAIDLLSKIIARNTVGQAYIFAGPEAVGKFTLAKLFSRAVISNLPFLSMLSNIKENEGDEKLPLDLIILEPEVAEKKGVVKTKSIPIEKIRDAQKALLLFPYEGKKTVLLINDAQRLTEESQNALLKTLEEPNQTSLIILIVSEEEKILPTIRSRCQKISFNLVSEGEIRGKLSTTGLELSFSLGRPGLAVKIITTEGEAEFYKNAVAELKKIGMAGINERLAMAEIISKNSPKAVEKLNLWTWIIHEKAKENIQLFSLIEKMQKSAAEIKDTNANVRLILENLFLSI